MIIFSYYRRSKNRLYYMKKLRLIKNQELFQGEKFLKKNKNYFEGWYFKQVSSNRQIAFIPGINIQNGVKLAFIQVITRDKSYFVNYSIDEFKYDTKSFNIQIGNNIFSKEGIHIDIRDENNKLTITGDIKYSDDVNIHTSFLSPNIMGFFSYLPFMECNHAVITMKNRVDGFVKINNSKFVFENSDGYIERDWGCSFPKKYMWCQGNSFKNNNASFMLAIALVDLRLFTIRGLICSLIVDDKEYRFATYNNAKVVKYRVNNKRISIVLKKGKYVLNIVAKKNNSSSLLAPVKGGMSKGILESITSDVSVTLKKKDKIIFSDTSMSCGLEIVE